MREIARLAVATVHGAQRRGEAAQKIAQGTQTRRRSSANGRRNHAKTAHGTQTGGEATQKFTEVPQEMGEATQNRDEVPQPNSEVAGRIVQPARKMGQLGDFGEFLGDFGHFLGDFSEFLSGFSEFLSGFAHFLGDLSEFLRGFNEFLGDFSEFLRDFNEFPGEAGEFLRALDGRSVRKNAGAWEPGPRPGAEIAGPGGFVGLCRGVGGRESRRFRLRSSPAWPKRGVL